MTSIGHQVIRASAGTGKTYALARRVVRLLALGVPPERVCGLTFSRKAAAEILDRVAGMLVELASDPGKAAEAVAEMDLPPGSGVGVFRDALRRFVDVLHQSRTGTIDSFTVTVVQAFAPELGLGPDFAVVDEDGAARSELWGDVLDQALRKADPGRRNRLVNAWRSVTPGREGKRFRDDIEKAIAENQDAFRSGPPSAPPLAVLWPAGCPWLGTDREAARAALAGLAGFPPHVTKDAETLAAFDPAAGSPGLATIGRRWLEAAEEILDPATTRWEQAYRRSPIAYEGPTLDALRALIRYAVGAELAYAARQTDGFADLVAMWEEVYAEVTRRTGRYSFSDVTALLAGDAVMSRSPEARLYIDYRLDARIDHWLLDEFQDTSDDQWRAFENLVDEAVQDPEGRRSFFYVGDIKQAIYAWRGGNAELFDRVAARYGPALEARSLTKSFRSAPAVIDGVNRVFGELERSDLDPEVVDRWKAQPWETHEAAKDFAGLTAIVRTAAGEDETDPVAAAAADILRRLDPAGRRLHVGILTKTNRKAAALADALRARCPDIPVSLEGAPELADNLPVSLLVSLLHLALHPGDTAAFGQLRLSPLADALPDSAGEAAVRMLGQLHDQGLRPFFGHWADALRGRVDLPEFAEGRLLRLLDEAAAFERGHGIDPERFRMHVEGLRVKEPAGEGGVVVMTIHKSKGLTFDATLLPELDMGMRPDRVGWLRGEAGGREWMLKAPRKAFALAVPELRVAWHEAERAAVLDTLRVLYVAMTRARFATYLILPPPTKQGTMTKNTAAEFFLKQLGDEPLGDEAWMDHLPAPEPRPPPVEPAPLGAGFRERAAERPVLAAEEPSAAEGGFKAGWLFHPERQDTVDFGTAMHELFRGIGWIDDTDLEALIADWGEATPVTGRVRADVEAKFRAAIGPEAIRAALTRPGGEADLWRERPFEVVLGDRWVSGVFDRVVIRRDAEGKAVGAEILDFKTDRVRDRAEAETRAARYAAQMDHYRQSLALLLRLDPEAIRARLLFTGPGVAV